MQSYRELFVGAMSLNSPERMYVQQIAWSTESRLELTWHGARLTQDPDASQTR